MNECTGVTMALTTVALAVAATILTACSVVTLYLLRQVKSWRKWDRDE